MPTKERAAKERAKKEAAEQQRKQALQVRSSKRRDRQKRRLLAKAHERWWRHYLETRPIPMQPGAAGERVLRKYA